MFSDNESLESVACRLDLFVAKSEVSPRVNIRLRARRVETVAQSRDTLFIWKRQGNNRLSGVLPVAR